MKIILNLNTPQNVVPDNSDEFLSLCQISAEGEYNHTKVYVTPERCFSTFFLTMAWGQVDFLALIKWISYL